MIENRDIIIGLHQRYHKKLLKILKTLDEEKSLLYDYSDLTIINATIKHDDKCLTTHQSKLIVNTSNLTLHHANISFTTN